VSSNLALACVVSTTVRDPRSAVLSASYIAMIPQKLVQIDFYLFSLRIVSYHYFTVLSIPHDQQRAYE
jgi:hypothetical protein